MSWDLPITNVVILVIAIFILLIKKYIRQPFIFGFLAALLLFGFYSVGIKFSISVLVIFTIIGFYYLSFVIEEKILLIVLFMILVSMITLFVFGLKNVSIYLAWVFVLLLSIFALRKSNM